ncbi:MAG: hypothetical protein ACT4NL_10790 [Pseudomarimonas sp.]
MRALRVLGISLLATIPHSASADVWSQLHGRWNGEGEVSGMQAAITLTFRPALGGRAHHLVFDNQMRAADGKTWPFAAEAIYSCATDSAGSSGCRGHWYDNRGQVLPLTVTVADDHLQVDWGDAGTERGRTEYRLVDKDRLLVRDEVLGKDGVWKGFGRSELQRMP